MLISSIKNLLLCTFRTNQVTVLFSSLCAKGVIDSPHTQSQRPGSSIGGVCSFSSWVWLHKTTAADYYIQKIGELGLGEKKG